jgi:hypothetical protein
MKDFLRHLYLTLMSKYGSFMWFGVHMGVTQVDWHWVFEVGSCVLINLLVLHTIYLEWKDKKVKD